MGNHGSSHQQQQHCQSHEMGRGWTQSFPRELARHHAQPSGHKVLPEPTNQRLRATNNGSIIHNGGTISGRKSSAQTLPHDLNKQGVFRSRSTSASNFGQPRFRRSDHHCCHYQTACESHCMENEMQELKRFGSEPDLRYSPNGRPQAACYYPPERDSRERESRYKGKKKYKAPAPPVNLHCTDGSSPDSCKWDTGQDHRDSRCRPEEDLQPPPPRRSRLFKTRAETKRAQVNWLSSSSSQSHLQERDGVENERRWRTDRTKENARPNNWKDPARHNLHQYHHQHPHDLSQRWPRDEQQQQQLHYHHHHHQAKSKIFDGKNTLQRSMSSPEFQAELMQVARKVRNKLNYNGREAISSLDRKGEIMRTKEGELENARKTPESRIRNQETSVVKQQEERRPDGRVVTRIHEERRLIVERCRIENKRNFDDRRSSSQRDLSRSKNSLEDRPLDAPLKKRPLQKTANVKHEIISSDRPRDSRKNTKERLESVGHPPLDSRIQDRPRRDHPENVVKLSEDARNKNIVDRGKVGRTRSESPVRQSSRTQEQDVRGQGSGRESTPEPNEQRFKDNVDSRWKKPEARTDSKSKDKRWPDSVDQENHTRANDKSPKAEVKGEESNWHILASNEKSTPKTFYFGMDEELTKDTRNLIDCQMEQLQSRLQSRELNNGSPESKTVVDPEDNKNAEDISLKLRPTLPKKQLEIPRFSPSAAWRLLSALEAPGPTMSTASEEIPVMFEERIERMSRPPPPLVGLGPRSSHDKSGDSGISGDAGAANDDSLDVSTSNNNNNRTKSAATRPTWTPQQDLGEESSSDAGVDSPPPMVSSSKFPPRAHVFSLSLPRDDNRTYLYNPGPKGKEGSSFNSLQKLKRSVSGALGLGPLDLERKRSSDILDDNWLLSTSAPTSLQHNNQMSDAANQTPASGNVWKGPYVDEEEEDDLEVELEDRTNDFPVIMKPPSFSYLASGGHVMYLPDSNGTDYQPHSLNCRSPVVQENEKSCNSVPKYRKNEEVGRRAPRGAYGSNDKRPKQRELVGGGFARERSFVNESNLKRNKLSGFSKSCENISEMKQRTSSPTLGQQNLQDNNKETSSEIKAAAQKSSSKGRRFTFQSTVRQIERRRLAEKLSREAEAKERQRKGELEAMRKVEEEFQRKRAREKANIRQQLRLYSMDENVSLPTVWDSSQLSRADPDGAPSSSASSPTSAPPGKLSGNRKGSVSSEEYHRKRATNSDVRLHQHQQPPREYKDYRPKYYDWASENSSHIEYKQTTIYPKVVCDIPRNSSAFVDGNHLGKTVNLSYTPRSDNYRKDFAHGAVATRSSLASSDSELSQPNTRPHSRQTGNRAKPLRSRSASPERSEGPASSEDESPVQPIEQQRKLKCGLVLSTVQPFVREKSYRPISFNPQPPPTITT
ncbi:serine/arginine repetitive matrix protein 2-like isoform X2 [Prorops nasuta]|uniref:serine/arginine repetitive matrix protein 2-like isoform X2 n=1 Tax=Prorops nasuta TaxID=863751 RepID=UPI0034CFD174